MSKKLFQNDSITGNSLIGFEIKGTFKKKEDELMLLLSSILNREILYSNIEYKLLEPTDRNAVFIKDGNEYIIKTPLYNYFEAIYTYDVKNGTGHLGFLPKQAIGEYTISIEDNGTNFAGVFGMSQFFEGDKAINMKVEQSLRADSSKIKGNKAPIDGDNSMANEMIQLQTKQIDFVNKDGSVKNESIVGYYRYLTSDIASRTESVIALNSTNQSLYASVYAEHQSISGVNMDEELSNLIRFQSSYGAAAKIITTVDQMLNSLLSIKQ